jgi:hypothetical protein
MKSMETFRHQSKKSGVLLPLLLATVLLLAEPTTPRKNRVGGTVLRWDPPVETAGIHPVDDRHENRRQRGHVQINELAFSGLSTIPFNAAAVFHQI